MRYGRAASLRRAEFLRLVQATETTHTAQHTGSDLLIWASDSDQQLKEVGLGHVSAPVYGYDNVLRYGPPLLKAWEKVLGSGAPLATPKSANGFALFTQLYTPSW